MLFAVIPAAPALVPAIGGRAGELTDVRAAVQRVVADVVDARPARVVVVGAAAAGLDEDETVGASFGHFGVDLSVGGPRRVLPAPHAVAAWWLDAAGWAGHRRYVDAGAAHPLTPDDAVLVVADGSARRSERAPGHLDPRAEGFDRAVSSALASGDAAALVHLDRGLAGELMVGGIDALHWLGRTASGAPVTADLTMADAPLGVGYWCATWRSW